MKLWLKHRRRTMLMAWGDNAPNKRLKSDGYVVHTTQGLIIALMPFDTDLGWWWDAEVESGVSMTFNLCGLWNKTAADEFYYSDFQHTTEGDGVARLTRALLEALLVYCRVTKQELHLMDPDHPLPRR